MRKRAFISGATSSIGVALARGLHDEGYELVLHCSTSYEVANKLAIELGGVLVQADFTSRESVDKMLGVLLGGDKFDVVINNAALSSSEDDKDRQAWERVFLINTITPALIMANADNLVKDRGVIINISSIYGHERFGFKDMAAYSASKAALDSLTRTFAKKLAPRVRVNAIAPGFVDSKWNGDMSNEERQRFANKHLTGELVTTKQVADLAMHMIGNDGIDGEVVYIDGGQTLKTI